LLGVVLRLEVPVMSGTIDGMVEQQWEAYGMLWVSVVAMGFLASVDCNILC
jgi:hypothetical protein